jgi:3-hydroxybutyryl-CoA dehydratase
MCSSLSSSREEQRGKTRNTNDTTAKRFQSNAANENDGFRNVLVLSKTRTFAREDVEQFAKITGDSNPIHVRRTAATDDDNNIVHGALLVSMFPAMVGSTFPGAKYLRQTAMFRNECPVGARVTATVRKVKETRGGKIVEFETKVRCAEDEGKVYVDGFALAKIE